MNPEKEFYLTKEGFGEIKKEQQVLKELRAAKTRGEAPKILESEDINPEWLSFQEDLNLLEMRLVELENIVKHAKLIKSPPKKKQNIVALGAVVSVEIDGEDDEFKIVGTLEANPNLGKISNDSPVGKALLGSREGEEVIVSSPIKTIYKIKKIRYA